MNPKKAQWLNFFVCIAASIVIIGALFKLQHWPFADVALIFGLSTEALIFFVYAFVPDSSASQPQAVAIAGSPAVAGLDKMLQEADITPANLQRLSENFQKLGTTVDKMRDISDVVAATGDYTQKTREAASAIGNVAHAYTTAAAAVSSFSSASESTKNFHEQMQGMTKNLASLNAVYELELQDTNNHLKALNKFYSNLQNTAAAMSGSVEDAKKTQEQISLLAKNLSNLNTIYGNMLSAMHGSK
ncbi:type IX secretion system motor protein PorL/GldL [Chitinophaga nivalis]|uniref:Gliding motility protein GldL n=1 Tax=Chitinophaga nivalis TaxID=2991709 RepID=A0ABT3IUG5_9BACT|nr:gliding motility protein GldL [Chitinophaga nivalis]MCW3462691.1 gliding motility protein GldL [Chitinophaga nivalis]MCW3487618.1 gliding motility protein GldL [Chitinophaga nivalis]